MARDPRLKGFLMPTTVRPPSVSSARSWLFVPGSRPERFPKALATGADQVIVDLEDSVPPEHKQQARNAAADWVGGNPAVVRINDARSPWHHEDLAAIGDSPGLTAVIVPKAESAASLSTTVATLDGRVPVLALVETAEGILRCEELARTSGVARLMLGNLDFGLDLGLFAPTPDESELLIARSTLVLASVAARLPAPVDGVHPDVDDETGFYISARRARGLAMGGKLCIHPRQISPANEVFGPTSAELAWAHKVQALDAETSGTTALLDGEMIDRPQYERARSILALGRVGAGE